MREIGRLRSTIHDLELVSFDRYGSLLLDVPRDGVIDRVWDGDPITLDPPCYPRCARSPRSCASRTSPSPT